MFYDGKATYSGLYIFNPITEASEVDNLVLAQALVTTGPIVSCMQAFT